jgi:hypothetical protein
MLTGLDLILLLVVGQLLVMSMTTRLRKGNSLYEKCDNCQIKKKYNEERD